MSSPVHAQLTGSFTTPSTLVPINITLPCGYDTFEIINLTDFGQNNSGIVKAKGYSLLPAGSAFYSTETSATALAVEAMTLTGGFTFVADSGVTTPGTPYALTAITNATPAVVSTGTTPLVGNIVRLYGTTGMLQVGGWDFTVSAVNPGATFTIANLPAGAGALNFAAAATAGYWELIPYDARYYPRYRRITYIKANVANPLYTDIVMSVTHGLTVGQLVRLVLPTGSVNYGMQGLNGQLATITAVGTSVAGSTNTITVNVSSAGMTAFTFPTSAQAALGDAVPLVVPVGETATVPYQNLLDDATINQSFTGVYIGTTVLVASKNYQWIATKGTSM